MPCNQTSSGRDGTAKCLFPGSPYSLEQIIMKCTQKSVDRRYNKMEDVIEDLKHSLIDPQGDFVKLTSVDTDAKTVVFLMKSLERSSILRADS